MQPLLKAQLLHGFLHGPSHMALSTSLFPLVIFVIHTPYLYLPNNKGRFVYTKAERSPLLTAPHAVERGWGLPWRQYGMDAQHRARSTH